jgi:CubicO group peptidase (beta-lactamase class C family)
MLRPASARTQGRWLGTASKRQYLESRLRLQTRRFSGLRPDLDLVPPWSGYEAGLNKALIDKPTNPPGRQFVYSDINFELLGEIVRRIGGGPLDQFAGEEIYQPLGMHDTMFGPPAALIPRVAPTEFDEAPGKILRGIVHDPTARYMGGVAGHAGLLTTAGDLMIYADMLLGTASARGTPALPAHREGVHLTSHAGQSTDSFRPGFDIDLPLCAARGDLFPVGGFGHTGFTGTSLYIDPATSSYWILLTNRVHPRGTPDIAPLRRRLGTVIAAAIGVAA